MFSSLNSEVKKQKFQKLIDNLNRIVAEIEVLERKTNICKSSIRENALIDREFFNEEKFKELENTVKLISSNIDKRIIPNLRNEMDSL